MAYALTYLGGFDLCHFSNPSESEQMGSGGLVRLSSHGIPYRRYGAQLDPLGQTQVRLSGVVYADTQSDFVDKCIELRGYHGSEQTLRRQRTDDGSGTTSANGQTDAARCDVSVTWGNLLSWKYAQAAILTLTLLEPWRGIRRGETATTDTDATYGDGYVYGGDVRSGALGDAVMLANTGNFPVSDTEITVTASGAIATISINGGDNSLGVTFSPALAADDVVVIDCGERTITKNGTQLDQILTRNAAHAHGEWLRIPNGGVDVTVTGGSGTVAYKYREAWR